MFKTIAAIAGALLLTTSAVQAADFKVDFSFTGFRPVEPGVGRAPFENAIGSFVYSASSAQSSWTSLKEFGLAIGDVNYSLSDVGFMNGGDSTILGGNPDSAEGLQSGTDDFAFSVFRDQAGVSLTYSSMNAPGYWYVADQKVTITELRSAVPEVETYAMLLAGLGLMGAVARRRKV